MKLYSARLSPFAARVRMAIYAKGLDVEILPPPGGPSSPEYRAINPIGKIPCLVTDSGASVPESDTIVEYLDERFPEPSLLPGDAEARARIRLLSRVGEVYVMTPMQRMFAHIAPETRDMAVVDALFDELDTGLGRLNGLLSGGPCAAGERLTQADCQLVPALFFVTLMARLFGRADPVDGHDRVAAYRRAVAERPPASRVLTELGEAAAHYAATGQLT